MSQPKFFALIIGTEILNRRRSDKHFDYLSSALLSRGHKLSGSFIIEDDPNLIVESIRFISTQPNAVLFSFGGIGSTPDDHTRLCAAKALRDGDLVMHDEARDIISSRVDTTKKPYALNMAMLPNNSKLLENSANGMPAFYIDDRYFFMPGFPEMSHPMIEHILANMFAEDTPLYRYTLVALCGEGQLIEVMRQMPSGVEFSSLPSMYSDGYRTTISVASKDKGLAREAFELYIDELESKSIPYSQTQEHNTQ